MSADISTCTMGLRAWVRWLAFVSSIASSLVACTTSHDPDAPADVPSMAPFCSQGSTCEPCADDPSVCERCELSGGRCELACGAAAVACPRPAADACGTPLAPCTTAGGDGQVCLVGTTMLRGSNDPDFELSHPVRVVYVSPFWLDVDEVTVGRYRECVASGGCTEPADPAHLAHLRDAEETLPVIGVTFAQATAFCLAAGGRLPTETEWERAAAGPSARPFPWGTEVGCERANWGYCVEHLTPVGSYPLGRSPEGVNDLIGNVMEMTSDRIDVRVGFDYTAYDPEPPCDPAHPFRDGIDTWVSVRGGSMGSPATTGTRALRRGRADPAIGAEWVGFRCARDGH